MEGIAAPSFLLGVFFARFVFGHCHLLAQATVTGAGCVG
jgi:hypothetical protein